MCEHECNLTLYQQGTEKKTYNMSTTQKLTVGWIHVSNFIEYKARIPIQCTSVLLIVQENSELKMILIIDVKLKNTIKGEMLRTKMYYMKVG